MDDERLKNPPGPGHRDYFDELFERFRDIRASEPRFYQKVLDVYATSVDYRSDAEASQQFFTMVQRCSTPGGIGATITAPKIKAAAVVGAVLNARRHRRDDHGRTS